MALFSDAALSLSARKPAYLSDTFSKFQRKGERIFGIVDWVQKEDVQKEMRRIAKRQLRAASYAQDRVDTVAESIVDLMKRRHGR